MSGRSARELRVETTRGGFQKSSSDSSPLESAVLLLLKSVLENVEIKERFKLLVQESTPDRHGVMISNESHKSKPASFPSTDTVTARERKRTKLAREEEIRGLEKETRDKEEEEDEDIENNEESGAESLAEEEYHDEETRNFLSTVIRQVIDERLIRTKSNDQRSSQSETSCPENHRKEHQPYLDLMFKDSVDYETIEDALPDLEHLEQPEADAPDNSQQLDEYIDETDEHFQVRLQEVRTQIRRMEAERMSSRKDLTLLYEAIHEFHSGNP